MIALPCMLTEAWLKNKFVEKTIKWVPVTVGIIFVVINFLFGVEKDTVNIVVGVHVVSLLGIGITYNDYYAILCALLFIMTHYGSVQSENLGYRISSENLYNYCLAGFVYSLSACFIS